MKTLRYIAAALAASIAVIFLCSCTGSVRIPFREMGAVLISRLFHTELPSYVEASNASILWSIRIPRVLTAFCVGGALSVCGAVMQSVLQNPLASSYTLGVSSGASLGAAVAVTLTEQFAVLGIFLLPVFGFGAGLITVFLVLGLSVRIDRNVQSHTVVLLGMVVSLFANAILTLVVAISQEYQQRILLWQMGSFSGRRWIHVLILAPVTLLGTVYLTRFHRELDILSFGDEPAMAIGVDTAGIKRRLLAIASLLTGCAVCFSGTIGFVDLVVPHIVRRVFGASHRNLLPLSMLFGGSFMALADLASRTLLAPREIPVGAVTALIGAPFFLLLYFRPSRQT